MTGSVAAPMVWWTLGMVGRGPPARQVGGLLQRPAESPSLRLLFPLQGRAWGSRVQLPPALLSCVALRPLCPLRHLCPPKPPGGPHAASHAALTPPNGSLGMGDPQNPHGSDHCPGAGHGPPSCPAVLCPPPCPLSPSACPFSPLTAHPPWDGARAGDGVSPPRGATSGPHDPVDATFGCFLEEPGVLDRQTAHPGDRTPMPLSWLLTQPPHGQGGVDTVAWAPRQSHTRAAWPVRLVSTVGTERTDRHRSMGTRFSRRGRPPAWRINGRPIPGPERWSQAPHGWAQQGSGSSGQPAGAQAGSTPAGFTEAGSPEVCPCRDGRQSSPWPGRDTGQEHRSL